MRTILHSDLNNCYATIECLARPELRGRPVAVGGDEHSRHGIILAKSCEAKACGVKTGEALWQARQKCPELIILPPDFPLYTRYCSAAREIYGEYTDLVEPFGMDEAWLDVSGSAGLFGSGEQIAQSIRLRIKRELGITVSVGVSFNKIFAKLASDMKKPDAVTVIPYGSFREMVWPLAAGELLGVGRSTGARLRRYGIETVGDLAQASPAFLNHVLGVSGEVLHRYALGRDTSRVVPSYEQRPVKSIGNSMTAPRDIVTEQDAHVVLAMLCDTVGERLRAAGFECASLQVSLRDTRLCVTQKQMRLERATALTEELTELSLELFHQAGGCARPLRSLGVRACELCGAGQCGQTSLYQNERRRMKQERIDETVDKLRHRFGRRAVYRAVMALDSGLNLHAVNADEL